MAKKVTKKKTSKKKTSKVNKGGRPATYTEQHKEVMLRLAPLGYTNDEIADIIGCTRSTFYKWLQDDPELSDALKISKSIMDSEVTQSLLKKALGKVETVETISGICPNTGNLIETKKVKQHAPDTTSMIFWLKNRRPDLWREKQEVQHSTSDQGLKLSYKLEE